jgi:predicted transcriptional regulator
MKLPCEVAVKSVVPAIRALLAKELTETHEMKQVEAAKLLGITQTAISKYTHHVRGRILRIEEEAKVRLFVKKTAASLANGELSRAGLVLRICDACKVVREKGLMCDLCKRANPTLDIKHCELCFLPICSQHNEF